MHRQLKKISPIVICIFLVGCSTYTNIEDNYNETVINMENYAIDDSKAYVHIEELEEGDYSLHIYKNMGKIEYAYYTVNVQDIEAGYNISIVKKDAVKEGQCSNILNEVVILKEYPKVLEITYNHEKIEMVTVIANGGAK